MAKSVTLRFIRGNAVGAPIAGYLSDQMVVRYRIKRGKRIPEDRLRIAWLGGGFLAPIALLTYGVAAEYVGGKTGFAIALSCLFVCGTAVSAKV